MIQTGDLAAFARCFVELEQLPVHAGADVEPIALAQQAQDHRFFAEHLADGAVVGDAVDGILAAGGC